MFYDNYFIKRSINFNNWIFPLIREAKFFRSIIVIPSYCESEYILKTLESINNQKDFDLKELLVIVVINNSKEDSLEVIKDNIQSMNIIMNFKSDYVLKYIDVFNENYALPIKFSGVGYTRKIGMDFALKYSHEQTILHCLDADTILSSAYLENINNEYRNNDKIKALIVDFEHLHDQNQRLNKYIKDYEDFLKITAKKINETGSPYGYVALGPTITCLAKTYVNVGGMVNKKVTEDFYFLQQLRKYTNIYFLNKKLVFPSSRLSDRVYLGTGFRMNQCIKGKDINILYYSDKSFRILKSSINKILLSYSKESYDLNDVLIDIDNSLNIFFEKEGLFKIWDKINRESKTPHQFKLQFHKWFDNLKTLRLLKFYS